MKSALIGYTGFVGSTLARGMCPAEVYRSTDIDAIRGKSFEHLVCAGVQAVKWRANKEPAEDWAGIARLLSALDEVDARRFTLISTVDVYPEPRGVNEDSAIDWQANHPYGKHRYQIEQWVRSRFPSHLILRLPGLFGPGLKKNVIFDMLHDNNVHMIHPDGVFQYYDTRCTWADILKAWNLGIPLLNVSSEPVVTREIRDRFFPDRVLAGEVAGAIAGERPPVYAMESIHDREWGGANGFLYSKPQILDKLANALACGM